MASLPVAVRTQPGEKEPQVALADILGREGVGLPQGVGGDHDVLFASTLGLPEQPPAEPTEGVEPPPGTGSPAGERVGVGQVMEHVEVAGVRKPELT